jgi:uncharacterized protein (TIGR02265 family)
MNIDNTARKTRGDFVKYMFIGGKYDQRADVRNEVATRFNFDIKNPPPDVPLNVLLDMLSYLHRKFYATQSFEDACEDLGRLSTNEFLESSIGKVYKITSKITGFSKSGSMFIKNLQTIFPWADTRLEETTATSYRVRIKNSAVPPSLVRGIMKGAGEAVYGAGAYRVELKLLGTDDFTCEMHK